MNDSTKSSENSSEDLSEDLSENSLENISWTNEIIEETKKIIREYVEDVPSKDTPPGPQELSTNEIIAIVFSVFGFVSIVISLFLLCYYEIIPWRKIFRRDRRRDRRIIRKLRTLGQTPRIVELPDLPVTNNNQPIGLLSSPGVKSNL